MKISTAQKVALLIMLKQGYILSENFRFSLRQRMYKDGLIYYETVDVETLVDRHRGYTSLIAHDAFKLTDKGRKIAEQLDASLPSALPASQREGGAE